MDQTPSAKKSNSIRSYFLDEAGDATLFDRKGHPILGSPGCSSFFILGFVDIIDPESISHNLEELRRRVLSDPYFKKVPSMQPEARKTALAFHAKDDVPEVRKEVFALLQQYKDLKFFAVVKDKRKVLEYVRGRNKLDASYHYNPNEPYDYLVRRLFRDHLHKHDVYKIYFAKRGKSDRTSALRAALEAPRQQFFNRWNILSAAALDIIPSTPSRCSGLQVADYFLWSLQRMYEYHEDRFVDLLWPAFRLVIDIDDTRKAKYGAYYHQKEPLTLAALESRF